MINKCNLIKLVPVQWPKYLPPQMLTVVLSQLFCLPHIEQLASQIKLNKLITNEPAVTESLRPAQDGQYLIAQNLRPSQCSTFVMAPK